MFHFRGSLLEVGRPPVVHSRSTLAGCRVCSTSGAKAETHGLRYDWILHPKVLALSIDLDRQTIRSFIRTLILWFWQNWKCIPDMAEKRSHFQFDGLRSTGWTLCYGQRGAGCQATVFQTLCSRRSRCGNRSILLSNWKDNSNSSIDFDFWQHQYHTKIDELIERTSSTMSQGFYWNPKFNHTVDWVIINCVFFRLFYFFPGVVSRLLSVLESVISKLARYDEGSILGSILSFTVISLFLPALFLFHLLFQLLYSYWMPASLATFYFLPSGEPKNSCGLASGLFQPILSNLPILHHLQQAWITLIYCQDLFIYSFTSYTYQYFSSL